MSRILIHSNAPWIPTGYGLQTRYLMAGLKKLGHEVAVSAFSGLSGADITWENSLIMPSGQMAFGVDVLIPHMERFQPDLTITLMDLWKLEHLGGALRNYNVAAWLPVDCTPLSRRDLNTLISTQAKPIAMSAFGLRQINDVLETEFGPGHFPEPRYVPHMVDMQDDFYPMLDREDFRAELGMAGKFVVGMCAANKDAIRKAFPEQFYAFSLLRKKYPESVLLVHAAAQSVNGLDLGRLAMDMGIAEHVRFTDQYALDAGQFSTEMMRRWYNALDTLMLCSYGEGFGIPTIEAQACGTPVVASNNSALSELTDVRNQVQCHRFWNHIHQAWWFRPEPESIARRLMKLHDRTAAQRHGDREQNRDSVSMYDSRNVMELWKTTVEELCAN